MKLCRVRLKQRHLLVLLTACFLIGMLLGIKLLSADNHSGVDVHSESQRAPGKPNREAVHEDKNLVNAPAEVRLSTPQIERHTQKTIADVNEDAHVFYYPWYGEPSFDGQYYHWDHPLLPHWDTRQASKWPKGRHVPPEDVGASFYPALGPYSSADPAVIEQHMLQIQSAGIGTLAVSWYPPGMADDNGKPNMPDSLIPILLDIAHQYQLKICIHIEPYNGRTHLTMKENLQYIHNKYGAHPAYYKRMHQGRLLPLFYIYDSYQTSASDWASLFKANGDLSVRNTELDAIFIGLIVEAKHKMELLLHSGFDGYYTYFASTGFSYGSNPNNWHSLQQYAHSRNAIFIPSVGPGYDDERVRPWNFQNTKPRGSDGHYYERMFKTAVAVRPPIVSITSFNEWGEGTQIEKAIPKTVENYKYHDYNPHQADFYLSLTRSWLLKFKEQLS